MICALGVDKNGEKSGLLGISSRNVENLQKGRPMIIDMTNYQDAKTLVIIYGDTELDLVIKLHEAGYLTADDVERARKHYASGSKERADFYRNGVKIDDPKVQ